MSFLSISTHLTLEEVLRCRSHCFKQLSNCYRDYYWTYGGTQGSVQRLLWKYGLSPFKEDEEERGKDRETDKDYVQDLLRDDVLEGSGETNNNPSAAIAVSNRNNLPCAFYGCKLKAMDDKLLPTLHSL